MRYCDCCKEHPLQSGTLRLTPEEVIERVCNYLKVDMKKVISKNRDRQLVNARCMISDMLYHDTFLTLSLKTIGELLGNRDHTTIINANRILRNLISTNPDFRAKYINTHLAVYTTTSYYVHDATPNLV
jgi:chromosomal replication initiator protein